VFIYFFINFILSILALGMTMTKYGQEKTGEYSFVDIIVQIINAAFCGYFAYQLLLKD